MITRIRTTKHGVKERMAKLINWLVQIIFLIALAECVSLMVGVVIYNETSLILRYQFWIAIWTFSALAFPFYKAKCLDVPSKTWEAFEIPFMLVGGVVGGLVSIVIILLGLFSQFMDWSFIQTVPPITLSLIVAVPATLGGVIEGIGEVLAIRGKR